MTKEQRFIESDWDYAIVLDACRYDVFEEMYQEYVSGTLEKRISKGSATPEWATKTFTENYDITYFSANPFINSLDLEIGEMELGENISYTWTACSHFDCVEDVWREKISENNVTEPYQMNDTVQNKLEDVPESNRTVIHYFQPHNPYLVDIDDDRDGSDIHTKFERYKLNLHLVLKSVSNILNILDGDVVITADHGEEFNEHGRYGHEVERHIPELTNVPWLEVSSHD